MPLVTTKFSASHFCVDGAALLILPARMPVETSLLRHRWNKLSKPFLVVAGIRHSLKYLKFPLLKSFALRLNHSQIQTH